MLLQAIFRPEEAFVMDGDALAWRWRGHNVGRLEPLENIRLIAPEDLVGIERQLETVDANTRQFLAGLPSNHVLMWGARGTGKSSLVKAMLQRHHDRGLRLVEVDAHDLIDLPSIVAPLAGRDEHFILFVDDLSFDASDGSYRALKAALDGSAASTPDNVVIYATSNRRHLLPEQLVDNEHSRIVDGELHHGEAVEEKISLSERFGIWLSFHPFSQDTYLEAVALWLDRHGVTGFDEALRAEALRWALRRGNRSGRVAAQFARDVAGRRALETSASARAGIDTVSRETR
ncbi:MAG: AAA family ATPase [Gammaproteobacteria bacterium]|nr:MAG: AAA family ATPase [Gammaproteobacteria bacterium]PIE35119.1 MAG: AAA family ATPase [Gammaproteobacteria bacterium]